ncbi:MAG TPA: JAB domain-containing protein [Hanamia sp.]|nr:JAB domain-containing protein [Hanamia sp.]
MKKEITQVAEISISYRPAIANKPIIKSPFDAYVALREFFSDDTIQLNEKFIVMFLNKANRVLGVFPVSVGGITSTIVDLRLILSIALKTLTTSIILCQNHPSGSLTPSRQDIEMTQRIKEAAKYLDICVQDHLIITFEHKYFSFADEGLI